MQSTSVAPWHECYYPIPKHIYQHDIRPSNKNRTYLTEKPFLTLTAAHSCCKEQEKKKNKENNSYPNHKRSYLEASYSSIDTNATTHKVQNTQIKKDREDTESDARDLKVILTNMWWADLKAAFGQRINLEGIVGSVGVLARDRHLALPHVVVTDIRYIDWGELKRMGFQGVVFDKDNTITVPYSLRLWGPLESSLERCKSVFGNDIAIFSNSAGLHEYDPDGRKARALEGAIGIKVIRHGVKKPGGTAEEIERHFGCESSQLVMVGDRPFTDIVYGNRNAFLTILTEPLSLAEEPFIVKQVRKLEVALVNRWSKKGLKQCSHKLFPHAQQCVKDHHLCKKDCR